MEQPSPLPARKRTSLVLTMLALAALVAVLVAVFIGWARMRAAQPTDVLSPVEVKSLPIAAPKSDPVGERVPVAPADSVSGSADTATARVSVAGELEATVRFVGRVVDTDRRPIAGAEVRFGSYPAFEHPTWTDTNGMFELDVPARSGHGEVFLLVSARAYTGRVVAVGRGSGDVRDAGDIVLEAGGMIAGRVVRPDDTPVEGVLITRGRLDVPYSELEQRRRDREGAVGREWPPATSAADGTFELVGAPVGWTRLAASARGFLVTFSELIEVRAGCVSSGVTLVLDPFEPEDLIRGVVLAPDGAPLADARVSCAGRSWGDGTASDELGRFVLELEVREVCDVLAIHRNGESIARAADTPPGANLVLRLEAMREVPVLVRAKDGAPVAGARVEVTSPAIKGLWLTARGDPLRVHLPPVSITARALAQGFDPAPVGPLDGASVERLEFVLQPVQRPPPPVRVEERVPELEPEPEPEVARLDGEFHGQITVDGAAPDGAWTIDLGWRETKDEVGPLGRVQLDTAGRFTWSKPALGDQKLEATIVGGALDGVHVFDTLHVSAAMTEWRRDLKTARIRIDGEFKPKQFILVWFDASGAWAGRELAAPGELTMLEGSIKLVGGIDRAMAKTPPSTWPALASGEARHGELLVLRAP